MSPGGAAVGGEESAAGGDGRSDGTAEHGDEGTQGPPAALHRRHTGEQEGLEDDDS